MKTCEERIAPGSDYYVYSPSRTATEIYLYPLQCGHFAYLPGYALERESYDSFLLMYVQAGSFELEHNGQCLSAAAGQFALVDCYTRHKYSSQTGWECLWIHFDGTVARGYYQQIISRMGNVFSLMDSRPAIKKLSGIYELFRQGAPVREALLSKYFTDILTTVLLDETQNLNSMNYSGMSEDIIAYINEHFIREMTVEELAGRAGMSTWHFIRTFKQETGFSPHQYLINTRMSAARYLLKNSRLSIKDICFRTGFSSESVFCSAFKRNQGMTPGEYRERKESSPPGS